MAGGGEVNTSYRYNFIGTPRVFFPLNAHAFIIVFNIARLFAKLRYLRIL